MSELAQGDKHDQHEVASVRSRLNDLESKLEERLLSINEALKCRREIESETSLVQDFLAIVTQDLSIAARIPPSADKVSESLEKLREHDREITAMQRANQKAHEAAEFLSQVAAGAENFSSKPASASHALNISYRKLTERIAVLEKLLTNLDQADKLKQKLNSWLDQAEKADVTKDEIDATKKQVESLSQIIDQINENSSPTRSNTLREDKRNIQRRLKSVENNLEQRLRDQSRRARKLNQLQNFLSDREQAIASSFEGELTPEFIHQKLTLLQTVSDELSARNGDFGRSVSDPTLKTKYDTLLSKVKTRIADLQEAKGQSQELDGLLQDFKGSRLYQTV